MWLERIEVKISRYEHQQQKSSLLDWRQVLQDQSKRRKIEYVNIWPCQTKRNCIICSNANTWDGDASDVAHWQIESPNTKRFNIQFDHVKWNIGPTCWTSRGKRWRIQPDTITNEQLVSTRFCSTFWSLFIASIKIWRLWALKEPKESTNSQRIWSSRKWPDWNHWTDNPSSSAEAPEATFQDHRWCYVDLELNPFDLQLLCGSEDDRIGITQRLFSQALKVYSYGLAR